MKRLRFLLAMAVALGFLALSQQFSVVHAQLSHDVTISLYRARQGADRTPYENIIRNFADAVFESSNGAHRLGTVTIYPNGSFADQADVVWIQNCHPNAAVSGRAVKPGQFISFCDTYTDGAGPGMDYNLLTDTEGAGYALGHEWGHYFYSLYDEYVGDVSYDMMFPFPHSTDTAVQNSIMNSQWNARGGNFAWLNFSTAVNNTQNTAQHRVYGASGWETLARPLNQDPRDGQRMALPQRIHYPELAGVAPGAGQAPAIDLPNAAARADLRIVWASNAVTYQIVIDKSGSMSIENKLENAKTAAKLLVDLAEVNRATVGVIAFDDTVTVVQPLTAITSQGIKDNIKNAIDTIQLGNLTAIGDAAKKALDDLVAFGATETTRTVFLLTNGQSNTGIDPLSVIPSYQAAQIRLFTFGFGSDANTALLMQLAQGTGGQFRFSPTTLADLLQVFQDAFRQATPSVDVAAARANVQATSSAEFPVVIDDTLRAAQFVVTFKGEIDDVRLILLDPDGEPTDTAACTFSGTETLCIFDLHTPIPGIWTLRAETLVGKDIEVNIRVIGSPNDVITFAAAANSLTGDTIEYPEPIVLLAVLAKELPILGAVVRATIGRPDGTVESFEMRDDGVPPDFLADDGLYSAILSYKEEGFHNITVQFDNSAQTAAFTQLSLQPSIGEDGEAIPLPAPVPVEENFQRAASVQVKVVNVRDDDHGNTPAEATALPVDNTDMAGRIDFRGDVDVFKVNAAKAGEIILRISNLALGMDPRLRVFALDGTTVLADVDLTTNASENGYLLLSISLAAGDMIFAEVSDRNQKAGGTYDISAGSRIASDVEVKPRDPNLPPFRR